MQPNYFTIPKPCSEDWNKMDGTEQGAFCEQCSKEVVDLTQVKTSTIKDVIRSKSNPCIRILKRQIDEMNWNEWFYSLSLKKQLNHAFLFAFILVFQFNANSQTDNSKDTLKTQLPSIDTAKTYQAEPIIIQREYRTDQTYLLRDEEEDHLMGVSPESYELMVETVQPSAYTADYFLMGDTIAFNPLMVVELNRNTYLFTINGNQLKLALTGKQVDKVEIRIYDDLWNLKYCASIRVEKGYVEIPYTLMNYAAGEHTIQLSNALDSEEIKITYPPPK